MRKCFIMMLAALAACTWGYAQEKMKVELKDGSVVSYDVENVSRFYFVTEEKAAYADYCDVEIEDETVMTNDAVFELDYGIDVAYTRFLFFNSASDVRQLSDEQIVELVKTHSASGQMETDKNLLLKESLEEGVEYAVAIVGFNAEYAHGAPLVHYFKTKVADEQPIVNVVNGRCDNDHFYFDTEIDDSKVLEYFLLTEVGNNLEQIRESPAVLGHVWKSKIEEDEKAAGQNYIGKSFSIPRTNGANTLQVVTWACDHELEFSGVIMENRFSTDSSSRRHLARRTAGSSQNGVTTLSKEELLSRFSGSMGLVAK